MAREIAVEKLVTAIAPIRTPAAEPAVEIMKASDMTMRMTREREAPRARSVANSRCRSLKAKN